MKLVRSLAGGLGFLTIWPFAAPVSAESVLGFPLAGVLVGLCLVVVRVGAQRAGALVVGALALAADALVTRGLHYDALADTADGLGGSWSRQSVSRRWTTPVSAASALSRSR